MCALCILVCGNGLGWGADNMYNWTLNSFKNHSVSPAVINFLDEQDAWTRQNIASNKSALWQQMGLL